MNHFVFLNFYFDAKIFDCRLYCRLSCRMQGWNKVSDGKHLMCFQSENSVCSFASKSLVLSLQIYIGQNCFSFAMFS